MSGAKAKPATAIAECLARLAKAGFARPEDMALIKPTDFTDETRVRLLAAIPPGKQAMVEVAVLKQEIRRRGNRSELRCLAQDSSAEVTLLFFNFNKWHRDRLRPDAVVRLHGVMQTPQNQRLDLFNSAVTMVQPRILPEDAPTRETLTPKYPSIAKISPAVLADIVTRAAAAVEKLSDTLPRSLRERQGILPLNESLRLLHRPLPTETQLREKAISSLKFDEWFAHILVQRFNRNRHKKIAAPPLPSRADDLDKFADMLPFALTSGQRSAMEEVATDLANPVAMRRLLHGDVGCGKTMVAAYACWLATRAGQTAALMAPTEILAYQHANKLAPLLNQLGIKHILLAGSMRAAQRKAAMQKLASDPACLAIGTHALFQDKVEMPHLALAVIDEQHRFGVRQRHALAAKGGGAHVLMMSATPIPRTMELGLYASLDVTKIPDRPHDAPINTLLFRHSRAQEVIRRLRAGNLQAYWICPVISASKSRQLRAAQQSYENLLGRAPDLAPDLLHGRQSADEKLAAMRRFTEGRTRLLVATTIVEAGIDAPEADVVVINHADRLGLSQLHQLRGRVGRGGKKGFCALLYDPMVISEIGLNRLKAMKQSTDGFEIAKLDLYLRGPGDIIGRRQSGNQKFRFANPQEDDDIISRARGEADSLLREDHGAAKIHWKFWLGSVSRFAHTAKSGVERGSNAASAAPGIRPSG